MVPKQQIGLEQKMVEYIYLTYWDNAQKRHICSCLEVTNILLLTPFPYLHTGELASLWWNMQLQLTFSKEMFLSLSLVSKQYIFKLKSKRGETSAEP